MATLQKLSYTNLPRNLPHDEPYSELKPSRWFQVGEDGLEVKELEDICHAFYSPYYMWNKDKSLYQSIIKTVIDDSDLYDTANKSRYTAYYFTIKSRYASLG